MINKISFTSFTGNAMTAVANKTAAKSHEYVSAAKIYTKEEVAKLAAKAEKSMPKPQKAEYTSPFGTIEPQPSALVNSTSASAESYALSHGTPINQIGQKVNIVY